MIYGLSKSYNLVISLKLKLCSNIKRKNSHIVQLKAMSLIITVRKLNFLYCFSPHNAIINSVINHSFILFPNNRAYFFCVFPFNSVDEYYMREAFPLPRPIITVISRFYGNGSATPTQSSISLICVTANYYREIIKYHSIN
jgi:hypothetical protein